MRDLILASASQSRARLLSAAGVSFAVEPASIDEDAVKAALLAEGRAPDDIADALAELKAVHVSRKQPGSLVLGADQLLVVAEEIVSKCRSVEEATALLQRLRGREHALVTAAVLAVDGCIVWRHVARSDILMRRFSDAFLADYIGRAGAVLLDCVGCYQLEGLGVQLFDRVEGDYFCILGLPLLPVLRALRDQGVLAG